MLGYHKAKQTQWMMLVAVVFVLFSSSCGVIVRGFGNSIKYGVSLTRQGRRGSLTEEETRWAKIAWNYFVNNYNYSTGLVNSVDRYPSASMWHVSDYMAALVSAYELDIIDKDEFNSRLSNLFCFMHRMSLVDESLPNLLYHTQTGVMVNYSNQPEELGWSARDIGRLLIWMKIIRERYPEYGEYIDKVICRWNYCIIIDSCGNMYSAYNDDNGFKSYLEGRLGFEEYTARGFQAWGFNTQAASSFEPFKKISIFGVGILYDGRGPRSLAGGNSVVSFPYILDGIEFGWKNIGCKGRRGSMYIDPRMKKQANNVYHVQKLRYDRKGILTARTNHLISKSPFFVYDTIFSNGYPWNTLSDDGEYTPEHAMVSTKAVFGIWALWDTDYTDLLMQATSSLYDPRRGWYEGRLEASGCYETTISISTNAMVLESLFYKKSGPIYKVTTRDTYYEMQLEDEFSGKNKCFPER